MRVLFDDRPDDTAEGGTYLPRALPGMEEAARPEQGLLWADVGGNGKKRAEAKRPAAGPITLWEE